MNPKIKFSGRQHKYTQTEIDAVVEAMQVAEPLTQGAYRNAFEDKFAEMFDVPFAFTTCNATAALEMTAQLCQFQEGDEVIIPAHTFTASAYPFVKKGAKIVWADIDLATRVISVEHIKACLTKKTKAVVVVHLYGYVADMDAIMAFAKKHNLIVIEDAAQSIGAALGKKQSGAFGDFGVFSFHSHKNITTLGEGGMLTVHKQEYADVMLALRHNGHCGFDFERQDYWLPAMGNVDVPVLNEQMLMPNNFCLGEVECALGIKLLDRIDNINEQKSKRAIQFIDALKDYPELEFHREDSKRHNYHLLAARVTNGKRDAFIRKMYQDHGIQCVVQYYPLYRYDFYQKLGFGEARCPNTDEFFDNMVSFPFHHWLEDEDIAYMLDATKGVLALL